MVLQISKYLGTVIQLDHVSQEHLPQPDQVVLFKKFLYPFLVFVNFWSRTRSTMALQVLEIVRFDWPQIFENGFDQLEIKKGFQLVSDFWKKDFIGLRFLKKSLIILRFFKKEFDWLYISENWFDWSKVIEDISSKYWPWILNSENGTQNLLTVYFIVFINLCGGFWSQNSSETTVLWWRICLWIVLWVVCFG